MEKRLSIMVLRAPSKAANCTLGSVQFPKARFLLSAADVNQFPAEPAREVAFAGRSNAGKSSAINSITARLGLARTSKTPGRTKLLNFFELEPGRRIIDLPGYGYAEATAAERDQWTRLIESLPAREFLAGLFLIVDIRRGITDADEQLLAWAAASGWQVHVLLTKSDKLNQRERSAALKEARQRLDTGMTAQLFSAHDRTGVKEAQSRLLAMLDA
ncbi:MAG TPA: ribosome biogenesis GTP-binding protein YihA/YsxC [Steroidobacteraceae bacterium]|nr:ribosome biogenesis GTP-binding protein YihA/YsxC [Steroidobacteraceae bacterium]